MSQAPRGKKDWIRDHYEKVILLAALVIIANVIVDILYKIIDPRIKLK